MTRSAHTRRALALTALVVPVLLAVLLPTAAWAGTERTRITWSTETDIDLHVYDEESRHAFYAAPTAIPSATLSSDNTVGFGPEYFTDDEGPGTARTFRLQACYFSGDAGPTSVSGTITDGDGASRAVSVTLNAVGDCADLGESRGVGIADGDGDGVPDDRDECPSQPAPGTANGCPAPPANQPPIAVSDSWRVRAGGYVYDSALRNDHDPDGDRFTPRVTSISFRAAEWSGMEPDGTFNYVSGPGTRVHQRKVITYHLVDERGAQSAPATMTIDVIPPGARRSSAPIRKRRSARRATASAAPRWYSNPALMYSCFGTGFDTYCFGVLSPAQVQAVNATTPWVTKPSPTDAARACARRFSGGGIAKCVAGLVSGPIIRAGDKQIIRIAAQGGECLLFRQDLNRTASHPLAGEWTSAEYSSLHSFLGIGKWGTWRKGLRSTWQVPVSCTANAAWKYFPRNLVER